MTFRLRHPLRPLPGESLPGLIMRNAAVYRMPDPRRLFRRLDVPKVILATLCQADPASPLGIGMRDLLGLDDAEWDRLAMGTGDDTTIRLSGRVVWREQTRLDHREVCPTCLAESPHHRAIWFVDAMPVCARHATRLLADCPSCNRRLKWTGPGVHLCSNRRCRFDLRKAVPELVPEREMDGVRALDRLFRCDDPVGEAPLGMRFDELLRLVVILGHVADGQERVKRLANFIRRERSRMHLFVDAGWKALDPWPSGFHNLLDGLRSHSGRRHGKGGLRKAFGLFAHRVFGWGQEPWGKPMCEAFAAYVAEQDGLAVNAHALGRYSSSKAIEHRYISMNEASKILDVGMVTMQRLATERNLFVLPPNGPGVPSMIDASSVRRLRDEMQEFLLPEAARKLVNVAPKVFLKMEQVGLVVRRPEDERIMESRPFKRDQIEEFLAACRGNAKVIPVDLRRQRKLWTMAEATAPGRDQVALCLALLDGRLRPAALLHDKRGLGCILLEPAEVNRVLPVEKTTLSTRDVGRLLGVDSGFVLHFARQGLLSSMSSDLLYERGTRFSQEAVETFRQVYILGGELARLDLDGGRRSVLSMHLRYLGVPMVSGPEVDGSKLAVFRRVDVTPDVLERIAELRGSLRQPQGVLRQLGFERVALAGSAIQREWGVPLRRLNNHFTDETGGRRVQAIAGRRVHVSGSTMFYVQAVSLEKLRRSPNAFVALVPNDGDIFLLVPLKEVRWSGGKRILISVRIDGLGRPIDYAEFAKPLREGGVI